MGRIKPENTGPLPAELLTRVLCQLSSQDKWVVTKAPCAASATGSLAGSRSELWFAGCRWFLEYAADGRIW